MTDENGWDTSATAWIDSQGENGDFTRQFVLDPVIDAWLAEGAFASALDVGCGEGRFCRRLKGRHGMTAVTGIDPTASLIAAARAKDPAGDYRVASAEALPFADGRFDLTVSYLTLIDIPDIERAIAEMARVTAPGGTLLIANLNPFITASGGAAWVKDESGAKRFVKVDRYLQEHSDWQAWRGIRILNHHRPMSRYMTLLLAAGLRLKRFDEPPAIGGPEETRAAYNRVPYAHLMEWTKD